MVTIAANHNSVVYEVVCSEREKMLIMLKTAWMAASGTKTARHISITMYSSARLSTGLIVGAHAVDDVFLALFLSLTLSLSLSLSLPLLSLVRKCKQISIDVRHHF